jgi:hypothetical protein
VGSFRGTRLFLIGQASGFIGGECAGADCEQRVDVLGPTGRRLNETSLEESGNGVQANDPTGGMIRARLSRDDDHGRDDDRSATVLLDAIDASGRVRWTRPLPERFPAGEEGHLLIGVDRKGNVLALWRTSEGRFGANTWAGQWFGHDGAGGPEFQALPAGATPTALYERVDSGLFVAGVASAGSSPGWLGQFEPLATSMSAAPSWLASRPGVALHMVHGGAGYALLPLPGASAACEQDVEVVSRSGQSCGTARFAVGGGSCTTSSIAVGYDGTVVQQLPREREAACTAAGHQCDCTYRFWPGFFR